MMMTSALSTLAPKNISSSSYPLCRDAFNTRHIKYILFDWNMEVLFYLPRCDIGHYKLKPRTNYCAASCSNIIRHFRHKKIIQRHWQTIVPGNPAELLSLIMVNPIPENGILPPFKQNISLMKPQIFGHNENKLSTSIYSTRNPAASGISGSTKHM